jgi:Tol biopolymer transport system component
MNDSDQTIISSRGGTGAPGAPPPPAPPTRNPLLWIGGIGCALLLCAGLLIGGAFYFMGDQLNDFVPGLAGAIDTPTPEAALLPTPTSEPATPTPEPTEAATEEPTMEATTEATVEAEETPAATEPEIGMITFALGATEDYEPINPGAAFSGEVTEVHAIFEYSGFSPEYSWKRVWYLDGTEVLQTTEAWSGAESGIFDYFINAGGEPLSPGEWVLELYVEDELLATGSFTIETEEEPIAEEQATPTEEATPVEAAIAATEETTATPATIVEAATATPAPTPTPQARVYQLAYTKWDGGKHNLFIGNTNGSAEQFIIGRAAGPSWTPDGQFIYFFGEEGIDRQVINGVEYVFDGVSNGIVRVKAAPVPTNIGDVLLYQGVSWKTGTARWASVSPNGQMVAYDAQPGGGDYRILFLGTDENQQFRYEILGEQASWSPDSQRLVYRSGRDGKTGIWISNRDDSGHTSITVSNDSFPTWSPDGGSIAFARDEGGNVDIYVMNVDGSNITRLTEAPGPDTLPVFTPDGQIIFRSARSGSWGIWKMNRDGSNQVEIIANAGVGPDWAFSKMSVLP